MVAGISVEQLGAMTKRATNIHRVIPMPPNEIGFGPIPVFPPSPDLESLLGRIGTVIPVEDENHFSTFSASSALMGVFFELVATNARWIESQGVSPRHGAMYSTSLFQALASFTRNLDPSQLQQISQECLTAGGLNEQILNSAKSEGWFRLMESQLDLVMQRITQ
jgi:pyrroline-5-carboxylate reductase